MSAGFDQAPIRFAKCMLDRTVLDRTTVDEDPLPLAGRTGDRGRAGEPPDRHAAAFEIDGQQFIGEFTPQDLDHPSPGVLDRRQIHHGPGAQPQREAAPRVGHGDGLDEFGDARMLGRVGLEELAASRRVVEQRPDLEQGALGSGSRFGFTDTTVLASNHPGFLGTTHA